MAEPSEVVLIDGGPITRSNQMYARITEIGENGPNGKRVMSVGYKGKINALPNRPLSSLALWFVNEILETARYTDEEALRSDIESFQQAMMRIKIRDEPTPLEKVLDVLQELVEDYEETDAHPTSDQHPLYAARKVLDQYGRNRTE